MDKANFDTTYCRNEKCKKCWRYYENWEFEDSNMYWFMSECSKEEFEEFSKNT